MVDLLALPLLLESTILAIEAKANRIWRQTVLLMFFLGIAIGFKLSNLFFAVPIVLVYAFNILRTAPRESRVGAFLALVKQTPIAAIIFLAPIAPFSVFIYKITGNPVFPLYNGIFKSPFWPQGVAFDPRWGPHNFAESLAWPVVMFLHPDRLCEFPYYSGRLTIGFIVAVKPIATRPQ